MLIQPAPQNISGQNSYLRALICMSLLFFVGILGNPSSFAKSSFAKSSLAKRHKLAYATKSSKNFLVPPPPPYVPSMLPELQYAKASFSASGYGKSKLVNSSPYSKYIYNRSGYEAPQPIQPNKYVTYWTKI